MLLSYRRVSTTEQAGDDKSSLENQERIARGFAMAKGFTQFEMSSYEDPGVSASIPLADRPAGRQLLADCKTGDTIFAARLDRMFRSASDALNMVQILHDRGIKLVLFDLGSDPISDSALGQFFFTVVAAVAQLERTMIKERCVNGKKAKQSKGGHVGGCAPFGYRIIGQGRAARLEEVEAEQQVLAKVRTYLAERAEISIAETCRRLTADGAASRNGKPFVKMQVSRMMERLQQNG